MQVTARIVGGTRDFGVRLVSGDGVAVAGKRWPPQSQRGGGRRLLFGDSGLAHALVNVLTLLEEDRIVAHVAVPEAPDREGRVEHESRPRLGPSLFDLSELAESGRKKMWAAGEFGLAPTDWLSHLAASS